MPPTVVRTARCHPCPLVVVGWWPASHRCSSHNSMGGCIRSRSACDHAFLTTTAATATTTLTPSLFPSPSPAACWPWRFVKSGLCCAFSTCFCFRLEDFRFLPGNMALYEHAQELCDETSA
eukprot:RCo028187